MIYCAIVSVVSANWLCLPPKECEAMKNDNRFVCLSTLSGACKVPERLYKCTKQDGSFHYIEKAPNEFYVK